MFFEEKTCCFFSFGCFCCFNNLLICSRIIGQMIWLDLANFLKWLKWVETTSLFGRVVGRKTCWKKELFRWPQVRWSSGRLSLAAWFRVWQRISWEELHLLLEPAGNLQGSQFDWWSRTASPELAIIRWLIHQRITHERQRVTREYLTERQPRIWTILPRCRRRKIEPMPTCWSWLTWDLDFANYPSLERR